MPKISQEQYQTMIARGMTPESISSLAQKKGYDLPGGKDFLQKATDVVTALFPGGKIGEAIGTQIAKARAKPEEKQFIEKGPSGLQIAGDVANVAMTLAGPTVGLGKSLVGRVASNTALGAGIGGATALAEGGGVKDVLKGAGEGALVSGALSTGAEAVSAFAKNLPKWLAKVALPKLENKNIPYALENVKIGPLSSIQKKSNLAISNFNDQIDTILSAPQYADTIGGSPSILGKALEHFPNANYTPDDLIKNAKEIAPNVAKILDKFELNNANVKEINLIRKELDKATQSVYTSLNRPPEKKLLGASLANALRDFVQTTADETAPIFVNFSKEVGLNKAIQTAVKKGERKLKFADIPAAWIGWQQGGFTGALKAIIAERVLMNPGAQLSSARLINEGTKITGPMARALIQGSKTALTRSAVEK